jgi:hypothetical protein
MSYVLVGGYKYKSFEKIEIPPVKIRGPVRSCLRDRREAGICVQYYGSYTSHLQQAYILIAYSLQQTIMDTGSAAF